MSCLPVVRYNGGARSLFYFKGINNRELISWIKHYQYAWVSQPFGSFKTTITLHLSDSSSPIHQNNSTLPNPLKLFQIQLHEEDNKLPHLSKEPNSPQHSQVIVLGNSAVSGENISSLLIQTLNHYVKRQTAFIEGTKYAFGDFTLRIGSLYVAGKFEGSLIDIEYECCLDPKQSRSIFKEWFNMLQDSGFPVVDSVVDFSQFRLPTHQPFSECHIAVQYISLVSFLGLMTPKKTTKPSSITNKNK